MNNRKIYHRPKEMPGKGKERKGQKYGGKVQKFSFPQLRPVATILQLWGIQMRFESGKEKGKRNSLAFGHLEAHLNFMMTFCAAEVYILRHRMTNFVSISEWGGDDIVDSCGDCIYNKSPSLFLFLISKIPFLVICFFDYITDPAKNKHICMRWIMTH